MLVRESAQGIRCHVEADLCSLALRGVPARASAPSSSHFASVVSTLAAEPSTVQC
jgi:hypothetical protein